MKLRRNSGDAARRRREREAAQDDTVEGQAGVLVARMRAGEVDPEAVALAAVLGDEVSRLAVPGWREEIRPAWRGELTADAQVVLRPVHVDYALIMLRHALDSVTFARQAFERSLQRNLGTSQGWRNVLDNARGFAHRGDWPRAFEAAALLATYTPAVSAARDRGRDWVVDPEGPQTRAWAAELQAQVADLIALLTGRPLVPLVQKNSGGDAERRRREREAALSGAPTDQAAALLARLRSGELGDDREGCDRITLAAVLGDASSRSVVPDWRQRFWGTVSGPTVGLPPDDPVVLETVANALRGYLRPWGPEIARQVYDLSGVRVEDRLQTSPVHDGRWRMASDRALTYMTQENFGAALEAEATAILFLAEGLSGGDAMGAEQDRQRRDMIAFLLRQTPPRTTIWPNPPHGDERARDREREARATQAPDALARVIVERMRAGALDPQHVRWAGMFGYEPARIALPGHDLPTVGGPWTTPRLIGLVVSEIAAASEPNGQPSQSPVLVGARIWSVDRSPCGRNGACAQEKVASAEARNNGAWPAAFQAARRCAAFSPVRAPRSATRNDRMAAEAELQRRDLIGLLLDPGYLPPEFTARIRKVEIRRRKRDVLKNSGDAERRRRERGAAMSGAPSDETSALAARVRAGEVSEDLLQQLAAIGYEPARVVAGTNRLSISRPAVLGDPEAQAQEVLHEVGSLTTLWPLACVAAILTASGCVNVDNSGVPLTNRLDRAAYLAAVAAIDFMRGKLSNEKARGVLQQFAGPLYGDVHPTSTAGRLLQAVALFYSWLDFETSSRSAGQSRDLRRDLGPLLRHCVACCASPSWSQQAAEAQIARAITAAVAPVLLTGRLEASPLIARFET